jgi:cell division protein FtsN
MRQLRTQRRCGTRDAQRGRFLLGLIVGLLVGLAVSLGVALYVTKVPVPFINKVPQRNAEQEAAQTEKNRNWDPNGPLAGKSAVRAPTAASAVAEAVPLPLAQASAPTASGAKTGQARETAAAAAKKDAKDPAGAAAVPTADPFTYFVQVGAYARAEDAEQQRANLGLMGLTAKVTEREQSGRTVYRVRVGPYERKEEADAAKERLDGAGIDSALVRVQRGR